MQVRDILQVKGRQLFTIEPDQSLAEVVRRLVERNCGLLVVCRGEQLVGIITERDILRACAQVEQPLEEISIASRMTTDVVTASPDDELESVMRMMTERRIRHLPVLDGGRLAGMVSIGDVVKAQHATLSVENQFMKTYIQS